MSLNTSSIQQANKQTVQALKKRIKAVGAQRVQKRIGFTSANLSYHLNPKDFAKVNMGVLEKITGIVEQLEAEDVERVMKLNKKATNPVEII